MREWLRKERVSNGYSQQFVANKVGITKQYYQQIEAGTRQKKMDTGLIMRFATVFGKTPNQILKMENAYIQASKA